MFCPNYKNREVFDGFNEMIEAFGGKPMTEEEFRSGELRNQRTGLDYLAMEATYRLYDLNGGNFLDLAPNGKPSLLFLSLLSLYNGDRAKAIVAKSEYYTKKYRNENEDWLTEKEDGLQKLFGVSTSEIVFNNSTINAVTSMAEAMGVEITRVDFKRDDVLAAANFLDKTIEITNKYPDRILAWNKLPEEVAHWWYRLLKNNSTLKDEIRNSKKTEKKSKELQDRNYGDYENEDAYTEEAIGQLIAEEIKNLESEKNIFEKAWNFIKSIISKYITHKTDPFETAAHRILNSDLSELVDISEFEDYYNLFPILEGTETDVKMRLTPIAVQNLIFFQKLAKQVLKFTKREKEIIAENAKTTIRLNDEQSNSKFSITPHLYSLEELMRKYKNGIPLNLDINLSGIKKIELSVYNKTLNFIRDYAEEYKNKKSIPLDDFLVYLDTVLNNEYLLLFEQLYGYLNYRIDYAFLPNQNGEYPQHLKIGLWFNNTKPANNMYTNHHFQGLDPYAFGSIVYFNDDKFALLHELLSDVFENMSEFKKMSHKSDSELVEEMMGRGSTYIPITLIRLFSLMSADRADFNHPRRLILDMIDEKKISIDRLTNRINNASNSKRPSYEDAKKFILQHEDDLRKVYRELTEMIEDEGLSRTGMYVELLGESVTMTTGTSFRQFLNRLIYKQYSKNIQLHKVLLNLKKLDTLLIYKNKSVINYLQNLLQLTDKLLQLLYKKHVNKIYDIKSSQFNGESVNEELIKDYFYPLVHHLIQQVIETKGRNVRIFIPGYRATMNLQGDRETANIYGNPKDLERGLLFSKKEGKDPQVGIIFSLLSKMKGIKLRYVENIEGLMGDDISELMDGYEIDISNYHLERPALYATKDLNGEPVLENKSEVSDSQINAVDIQFLKVGLNIQSDQILQSLLNGEVISSRDLINHLISNNIFSGNNINLANILSRHDILIRFGENMDISEVMSTIYDKKTKKSIILVNKNNLSRISNRYLGQTLLHELIHSVTLSAITNPSNEIESKFQSSNSNIFNLFNKLFKDYVSEDLIPDEFYYAFLDESEFAAEFITNSTTRLTLYDIARQLDNGKGRILNSIKRYINNIAKLLINKSIFNTAEQLLKDYENQFYDYLNGIQPNTEGMSESEIISALDNISNVDDYDSVIINLQTGKRITDRYVKQNKIVFGRNKVSSIPIHRLEEVSEMLNVRIDAIRTSNFDEAKKLQLTTLTQTQSEMFLNEEISKYVAITTFITSSKPQIIKDYDELRKAVEDAYIGQEVPNYIHQLHANFGMYKNIISTLLYIIEDPNLKQQIVDEYNDGLKSEEKIQLEDLDIIKSELDKIDRLVDSAIRILTKVRTNNALTVIHNVSEKVKNPEAKKYIEAVLEDDQVIDKDLNWLWLWVGSADSMQDEAVRTMSYLITDANQKTDKKTRIATVKLLNAAKRLKVGEKQSDIYETFEDGTPTQYLVRDLNFGRFYRDYDNFLFGYKNKKDVAYDILGRKYKKGKMVPGLNQIVSEKFNIKLKNDARVAPEGKDYEDARLFWNEKRNDWLDEHCHRKFNRKYYDAWNHVPFYLKQTLDNYTTRIQAILSLPGIVDEKGHKHLDLLSPELYNEYEDILIQRRLLYSPRDMYGNLKTGQDLEEYQILKKLRDTLYPKKKDPKTGEELPNEFKIDYESWEESRLRKAELLKQKYGENSEEYKKKMLEWHRRNSRLVFKKGKNGAAIFERIDELVAEAIGKEVPDWGEEVKKKQDAIREIINSRKDEYGEPIPQMFYDQTVLKVIELQKEVTQLKRKIVNENSELKAIRNTYNEIFEMYLEYVDTEYYAQMKEDMRKTISDEDVDAGDDMFDESFGGKFGYYTYSDDDEGSIFHPYKHLQKLLAIDINKWMEFVPNNSWIDTSEEDRVYINKDFDESYNSKMVPKRELYDNRKNFKKIKGSESLRNFYDTVLETLKESNSYQTNRMFVDNYRLPGITGSLYDRLKNNPWHRSFIIILLWIGEKLGLSKPLKDFVDFGMTLRQDDEGEILPETVRRDNIRKIIGAYPDGRSFNILPLFFTRKLDDTSLLSRDVVKIVSNYYRMSVAYSEKKKIQEQCETLLDFLKAKSVQSNLQYSDDDKDNKNKSKKQEDSDLYKYAKRFLERSLYDIKINKTKIFGLEITRVSQSAKVYTTWRNLGLNPKVAITGFLTTLYVHILNSVIGEKYSVSATVKAFGEMIKHVGSFVFGNTSLLGNLMPKNDVSTFAAEFGVADEAIRQLELTHFGNGIPGRVLRTVKNSVYSFLTIGDYLNKCSIMLSVLNSYKYLDGEFITLFDLKAQRYKYSEKEFKDIVKRFKKAPTLRSMLKGNSGVILFLPKSKDQHERELQKQAWENAYHTVKSRIQKWGQLADGMLTDEQKTYLQATTLGSFFLIHRSYIITYLNEWYGDTVYDYDTQQYKNGHFRFLLNFINELQQNNLVLGALSSAGAGAVLAGPLGASIGGAISIGRFVRSTYLRSKNNEQKSTVLEIFKKFFADYDNEISTKRSYHNRALAKQIFLEIMLYNLPFVGINALVNSICARYDDDDRWWVQVLLYGLRGFQWESYTHFRFGDLFNTVKNLSASISVVDKVEMFVNGLVRSIFPRAQAVNFNTLRDLKESVSGNMVGKRDRVYYGNTKLEKFFDELFPHSNLRKQIKDSRSRRHYFENQIMQLDKEERGY